MLTFSQIWNCRLECFFILLIINFAFVVMYLQDTPDGRNVATLEQTEISKMASKDQDGYRNMRSFAYFNILTTICVTNADKMQFPYYLT